MDVTLAAASPMSPVLLVAIVGLLLEAVVIVVGAVWIVARIKTTTMLLTQELNHHAAQTTLLRETIDGLREWLQTHDGRITRLEARVERQHQPRQT